MPGRDADNASASAEKWILAVIMAWQEGDQTTASARNLAQRVGLPTSSIYHHFGDMEQLYVSAHEYARADAQRWCDTRLEQLTDMPEGREAFAPLLATLIDDWCEGQRGLAFAWRESTLLAARDPRYAPVAQQWCTLWAGFWRDLCERLAIPHAAMFAERLFDGESFFHLLRWRRTVDRAGLDELCRAAGNWLAGALAGPSPWRDMARALAQADAQIHIQRDATAERVAAAAATIVARSGAASVTHRAVAAEAGLTLGVVSHKFKTSADLLGAAFEEIYRRNVPTEPAALEAFLDRDTAGLLDHYRDHPLTDSFRLASKELMMAAMRNPGLAPFAAQLRYMRGRTARHYLQALLGPDRVVSPLDAAIFSGFSTGQSHAHLGMSETERADAALAEREALLAMLQGRQTVA